MQNQNIKDLSTRTLHNGVKIPTIGFGCAFGNWADKEKLQIFTPEEAWYSIPQAFNAGYRHFDTALIYGTHHHLGSVLGQKIMSGELKREDVFITTKIFHFPAVLGLNTLGKTFDMSKDSGLDVKKEMRIAFEKCLDELHVGYVDMLLMHWPGALNTTDEAYNRNMRKQVWEVFEEIYKSGRAKAIGVSNFNKRHLETMIEDTTVVPMYNQLEFNPYIQQRETVDYCLKKNILPVAWAPFGSGDSSLLKEPKLVEMAEKYKKNVGQVILRWIAQQGLGVLPKSGNPKRMASNLDIFDFEISQEDIETLNKLEQNKSSVVTNESIA